METADAASPRPVDVDDRGARAVLMSAEMTCDRRWVWLAP